METKKIDDLKKYHKNPRKITEKMYKTLASTLREFGDLSGIVVNIRTDEVIGGNQRTQFFKDNREDVQIEISNRLENPTAQGTVATGYVLFGDEKFSYREVDWDEKKTERANIVANKVGGFWDMDILANEFDLDDLKTSGFEDFELGFANEKMEIDTNDLMQDLDTYLDGNIKQIVLYFSKEQFDTVIPRLDQVMQDLGITNHTEAVLGLLKEHEDNRNK